MPIKIHGKEYVTVAERVKMLHDRKDLAGKFSIETEVLSHDPIVIKATVNINDQVFTGISSANPNKPIEKQNPYECCESSSIGRALGFAGFGVTESIASADEMLIAQARSVDEFESKQYCQKCNADSLILRTSRTGANLGKAYYYCTSHNGFSHWAKQTITAGQA